MVHVLNAPNERGLAALAIECTSLHVPGQEIPEYWLIQRRVLLHADRCQQLLRDVDNDGSRIWVPASLGRLYGDQGRLKEAEAMYERALQGKEKAWRSEHTSTLDTVNNLAALYKDQGWLKEAEAMYERALQGYEKAWGPEHTLTLNTVNNLGLLYEDQGRLKEAEAMYERALQGYEKALGDGVVTYVPFLNAVTNLGLLNANTGQTARARELYTVALTGFRKVFGDRSDRHKQLEHLLDSLSN